MLDCFQSERACGTPFSAHGCLTLVLALVSDRETREQEAADVALELRGAVWDCLRL